MTQLEGGHVCFGQSFIAAMVLFIVTLRARTIDKDRSYDQRALGFDETAKATANARLSQEERYLL
jgi:hypothetical protein